jgi:uncharacterized protein YkwD
MFHFEGVRDERLTSHATIRQESVQSITQNANNKNINVRRDLMLSGLKRLSIGLSCLCIASLGVFYQTPSQARQRNRGDEFRVERRVAALPRQQQQSRSMSELRVYALELVNRDRQARGLPPLVSDPIADRAAQFHAQDMLRRHFYDHFTPEGLQARQRYLNQGGRPVSLIGENLFLLEDPRRPGLSFNLAAQLQKGWMRSSGHRDTILMREFSGFGYGIVAGPGGRIYAVQVFTSAPDANTRAAK